MGGGGEGDSRPKGIPLFQVYERVGVSGLLEVCNRIGKSVISVAKGTKCLQMQFMVVKKIVTHSDHIQLALRLFIFLG